MSALKAPPGAAILLAASLLAGCSGGERLSAAMASINREYGAVQDEALLLNILRRSASLPAHFTSLSIIRGRSRVTAGANLSAPFGGDAPARFDFNPHLSIEQGPSFEVSTQDNQEFYRGYSSPVDTTTTDYYLRQDHPKELILSLFLNRIRIDGPGSGEAFVNIPDQQGNYEGFQNLLGQLVDQGLTTVQAPVARHVGPELSMQQPPSLEQVLSLRKEGLAIEEVGAGRYQIMQVSESARFCFARPHEPLFEKARCGTGLAKRRRLAVSDPAFFGSAGGSVAFAWEGPRVHRIPDPLAG